MDGKHYLGIELGSTRIKAVSVGEDFRPHSTGDYTWASRFENGIWTYDVDEAWIGLKTALRAVKDKDSIASVGLSGMMHGYLAFDKDWNLLVPFRTWQNTITPEAAEKLTALLGVNIPQRWSIAHLYQAILNGEEHIDRVAHITSLAGYIHYRLTGVNAVGICEASGMFPVDPDTLTYDEGMICKFEELTADRAWNIRDVLPTVLVAGQCAGHLTAEGAELLDNQLPAGLPFAPPEGDGCTGMTATNSVSPRTGNVSAGTSVFAMVVLEKPLREVHEEIDVVMTPAGKPVAMVHGNNCTNDMNAWVSLLREASALFGAEPTAGEVFTKLYQLSLEGEPDCGGITVYNYLAGEVTTHLNSGRPMVVRRPDSRFTLANFIRAQLYSTVATLSLGMDILAKENVAIDCMMGHGGLFKTPVVGQRFMAAACNAPVTCMATAGEGGPYGMALLSAYLHHTDLPFEDFLAERVFAGCEATTIAPDPADLEGFLKYRDRFAKGIPVERAAVELM